METMFAFLLFGIAFEYAGLTLFTP